MTPRLPVAAALLWCFAPLTGAEAHGWYSQRKDPAYGNSCCGGTDCAMLVLKPGTLTAKSGGYHICLMTFFRGPPRGGICCFFAPPDS